MLILAADLVPGQVPVTVKLKHTVRHAHDLMIGYGYNQLPIIDELKKPIGIVTARVIVQNIFVYGADIQDSPISSISYEIPHIHPCSLDVISLLDRLNNPSAILFTDDKSGELSYIITSKDTSVFFRQKSEELIHLRIIDKFLRQHVCHVLGGIKQEDANGMPFDNLLKLVEVSYTSFQGIYRLTLQSWSRMMENVRLARTKVLSLQEELSPAEKKALKIGAELYARHLTTPKANKLVDVVDPFA